MVAGGVVGAGLGVRWASVEKDPGFFAALRMTQIEESDDDERVATKSPAAQDAADVT
jgi:hypothetical protein